MDHVDLDYVLAYARTALATIAELAGAAETIDPPAPTPTPEPATATPTATPGPSGCVDLVVNGGWEGIGGWRYGTTPFSARVVSSGIWLGLHGRRTGARAGFVILSRPQPAAPPRRPAVPRGTIGYA